MEPYDLYDNDYVLPTDLTDIYETPSAREKPDHYDDDYVQPTDLTDIYGTPSAREKHPEDDTDADTRFKVIY